MKRGNADTTDTRKLTNDTANASQINNPDNDIENQLDLVNLRLYTIRGKMIEVEVSLNLSGIELKREAILKLVYDNKPNYAVPNDVCDLTRLIYSKTQRNLNENIILRDMGLNHGDEFVLIKIILNEEIPENLHGPTLVEVLEATKNVHATKKSPPKVDIVEVVPQNEVELDIRMIIITLARCSAYVIGAGPFADRLISTLKLRILNRPKDMSDVVQCLVDMGFSKERVIYALLAKNNIFSDALEWLIDNQSITSLDVAATPAPSMTSKMSIKSPAYEKVETLLEIIRINSHNYELPNKEMIEALVEMGFTEKSAIEALKVTRNNQAAACEWLAGNRSNSLTELRDGLPRESSILKSLLLSPQIQLSFGNPKMFAAYISILENYQSISLWLGDKSTSAVLGQILRTYHEEKTMNALNQFSTI